MADYATMMVSLRESLTVPTKRDAGMILAAGGWAVFPVPNNAKFDTGLSYLNATTEPSRWWDMCESVMYRHECHDVNIALCPGKCVIPLIVVDLDGTEAIWRFFEDARAHGHEDVGMWLRVNTTRSDYGRHMYFASPEGQQWANSTHVWGGDVRSGRGHVVMPPSSTELGRYTWAGETLYQCPPWVLEGLRGGAVKNQTRDGDKTDEEISELLEELSQWAYTSYGRKAMDNMLAEMTQARPGDQLGGRNPHLAKTINRVLDLAVERHLNALEAVNEIADTYVTLFSPDEGRSPLAEVVRCVNSWMRNHENVKMDAEDANIIQEWANQRGSGEVQELPEVATVMNEINEGAIVSPRAARSERRLRRRVGDDWKSRANK